MQRGVVHILAYVMTGFEQPGSGVVAGSGSILQHGVDMTRFVPRHGSEIGVCAVVVCSDRTVRSRALLGWGKAMGICARC